MDITERIFEGDIDYARGRRLVMAMDESACKRAELSHLCEVSERQITRWRSGHPIHQERHLETILTRCEISREFLLFGNHPGLPPSIIVEMSDNQLKAMDAANNQDELTINRIRIHRLHVNLLRHIRKLPDTDKTAALDRVINNRWAGAVEPFKGSAPLLDGIPLDRYEIAAVLALRAIADVGREVALINHMLSVKN